MMSWAYQQFAQAKRIDIRLDFKGQYIGLIDLIHQSCEQKELCRCRRWLPLIPRTADGNITGKTIQLGKRGKEGSGRFVRAYDKGLETGEAAIGEWERWETEFADDAANQVCMQLVESDDWKHTAAKLVLAAVEFRVHNGSRSLKRRALSDWWAKFTESIKPVLVKIKHTPSTIDSYGSWLRKSVMPAIHTMAHHSGQTVMQVTDFFVGKQNFAKSVGSAPPVVWAYLDMCPTPAAVELWVPPESEQPEPWT
jgi:DNA relaxase NicK